MKKIWAMKIIGLVFLIYMSSCVSTTEKGYIALNEGRIDESLLLFQEAVKTNSNPEAVEGLRKAKNKWIETKLIEVRLLRLAQNYEASEELLKQIIQNENSWQIFPLGAAFSTQSEEIRFLIDRIKNKIQQAVHMQNPLLAQLTLQQNEFLLKNTLKENVSEVTHQVYQLGNEYCQKQEKEIKSQGFFKLDWLIKTCQIWKYKIKNKSVKSSVKFFKNLTVESNIVNLNEDNMNVLNKYLTHSFKNTKWHSENGIEDIKVKLNGHFSSKIVEIPVQRVSRYFIEVPYEETYKRVKNTNHKNNSILGSVISLLLIGQPAERVYDNNDGTETVSITKYRREPKDYSYLATRIKAEKNLMGQIDFILDRKKLNYEVNESWKMDEDKHSENFSDAGLTPTNPKVLSDHDWILSIGDNLIRKLTNSLQSEWVLQFCNNLNLSAVTTDDLIHRCAYQVTTDVPEILNQYYLKNWKMTFAEYKILLSSVDSIPSTH